MMVTEAKQTPPKIVKFTTFQQLVDHGIQQYKETGRALVGGMPWAFLYDSIPVTHENDRCYIIAIPGKPNGAFIEPGDLLLTLSDGSVAVAKTEGLSDAASPPGSVFPSEDNRRGQTAAVVHYDEFAYKLVGFGQALDALLSGKRVSNLGWNGKDMWLAVSCQEPTQISSEKFWSEHNRRYAEQQPDRSALVKPCITMKTADGSIQMGWVPSQADMFSTEWFVLQD